MSVFTHAEFDQHEQVSFFNDEKTGLRGIVAVHNTRLGPALGGCRMWNYETDTAALTDVLRLSRGMTYKAAIAGLPLGGGKSVIIGDSRKHKTADLMRAMGRAVETLRGKYIAAEDVGMVPEDIITMGRETMHAIGADPSPTTAYGVYIGLKAAVKFRLGRTDLKGLRVAVQGLGNVGYGLCKLLAADGAKLFVTDVQTDRIDMAVRELGATPVALHDIFGLDVDVFAPCALGGGLNDSTIGRLRAKVIAGGANNQLAEPRHGEMLRGAEILYAPDYVINAGGLIHVYYAYQSRVSGAATERSHVMAHVDTIAATAESIFRRAEQEGIPTGVAADRIAEQRFKFGPLVLPDEHKAVC